MDETFTDALGQRFERAGNARIVSLVPSITETLIELGLRDQVVGRTGFCIHPREAVAGADCVITDTWVSMGDTDADASAVRLYEVDFHYQTDKAGTDAEIPAE